MSSRHEAPAKAQDTCNPPGIVIVGTGLAGYTVAREIRRIDRSVRLMLLTQDAGSFYSKPMISNAFALKKQPAGLAMLGATDMARDLAAEVLTRRRLERVRPDEHVIETSHGPVAYEKLVLALGADPRRVAMEGSGATDVLSINDLDDYAVFRAALEGRRSVAILGAGLIGCELANDLAIGGFSVALIDPASTPLSRLLPANVGTSFAQGLRDGGIRLHLEHGVTAIHRAGEGYKIDFSSGASLEVDVVVSAIGLVPRVAVAREAGLRIDVGIWTDEHCRTSARDVYALGDCAALEGRLQPYVMPLMLSARALAATLCGKPTPVRFPVMPISVKTPAMPAVLVAPSRSDGIWHLERVASVQGPAVKALCRDPSSHATTGFTLLGSATQEKAELLRSLSAPAGAMAR